MIQGVEDVLVECKFIAVAREFKFGAVPNHECIQCGRLQTGNSPDKGFIKPVIDKAVFFLFFEPGPECPHPLIIPEPEHPDQLAQVSAGHAIGRKAGLQTWFLVIEYGGIGFPVFNRILPECFGKNGDVLQEPVFGVDFDFQGDVELGWVLDLRYGKFHRGLAIIIISQRIFFLNQYPVPAHAVGYSKHARSGDHPHVFYKIDLRGIKNSPAQQELAPGRGKDQAPKQQ